jgi:hypothetical protein
LSFSLLEKADIDPSDIFILDRTYDACLFRVGKTRYIYGEEPGSKRFDSHFLARLRSSKVRSVEDAFREYAGRLSDEQYTRVQNGDIYWHGPFFYEPHPELDTRVLKRRAVTMKLKVDGVEAAMVKLPWVKNWIRGSVHRDMNYGYGVDKSRIRVVRIDGVPCYVVLKPGESRCRIPKNAFLEDGELYVNKRLVNQYGFGYGVSFVARDAVTTRDGLYVRGTVRNHDYKMLRLGTVWHRVVDNNAKMVWRDL